MLDFIQKLKNISDKNKKINTVLNAIDERFRKHIVNLESVCKNTYANYAHYKNNDINDEILDCNYRLNLSELNTVTDELKKDLKFIQLIKDFI